MVGLQASKSADNATRTSVCNDETLWPTCRHDIDIWGPMAERIAEQVPKGSRICVQGKLSPTSWTNKEGVKQTRLRVRLASWACSCSSFCNCGTSTLCLLQISASEVRFIQREQQPSGVHQQGGWGQQQQQVGRERMVFLLIKQFLVSAEQLHLKAGTTMSCLS